MIDQLATRSRQCLGATYIVIDYLGECGLTIAFFYETSFVSMTPSFLWVLLLLIYRS